MPFDRIVRKPDGRYRLELPFEEQEVLRTLPAQLREILDSDDPSLRRLFPPAYEDDEKGNAEYAQLMRGELLEGKRAALEVLEQTVDADMLDEEQMLAWLGALESLRLVLGTAIGVTEETYAELVSDDDAEAAELALYGYLSWLQEQAVAALAANL